MDTQELKNDTSPTVPSGGQGWWRYFIENRGWVNQDQSHFQWQFKRVFLLAGMFTSLLIGVLSFLAHWFKFDVVISPIVSDGPRVFIVAVCAFIYFLGTFLLVHKGYEKGVAVMVLLIAVGVCLNTHPLQFRYAIPQLVWAPIIAAYTLTTIRWGTVVAVLSFIVLYTKHWSHPDAAALFTVSAAGVVALNMIMILGMQIGARLAILEATRAKELARRNEVDLTTLKEGLEESIKERTQQLEDKNTQLEQTIEMLSATQNQLVQTAKQASLSSFVSGLSHELNTPLGNTLLALGTLESQIANNKAYLDTSSQISKKALQETLSTQIELIENAMSNLNRAVGLMSSLRQISSHKAQRQVGPCHVGSCIQTVIRAMGLKLKKYHVQVVLEDQTQNGTIMSFISVIDQVLIILIDNALMHAFDEQYDKTDPKRINVKVVAGKEEFDKDPLHLELPKKWALGIEFSDNGMGIDANVLDHLFDPFVSSKIGRGGVGLGLNIMQTMVKEVLGGGIEVKTTSGTGTTFTIWLPASAPAGISLNTPASVVSLMNATGTEE